MHDDQGFNLTIFLIVLAIAAIGAAVGGLTSSSFNNETGKIQESWASVTADYNGRIAALEELAKLDPVKEMSPSFPDDVKSLKERVAALKTDGSYSKVTAEALDAYDDAQGAVSALIRALYQNLDTNKAVNDDPKVKAQRDALVKLDANIGAVRGKMIEMVSKYNESLKDSWIAARYDHSPRTPIYFGR